jgi:hypothetical protein
MRSSSRSASKQPGCAEVQCMRGGVQELQEFRSSGDAGALTPFRLCQLVHQVCNHFTIWVVADEYDA